MHLISQYYNHPNPERQKEIDLCLKFNLENPAVTTVHNLIEKKCHLPQHLKDHPKHKIITSKRLTYRHVFEYISSCTDTDNIVAVCNNDIFINNTNKDNYWQTIKEDFFNINKTPKILNLSRYEYDHETDRIWREGTFSSYSSDCWVFQLPILKITDCNFYIGVLFADWAIAGRFRDAGYHVYNWATKYKIFHLDRILNRQKRHPKREKHTISNSPESKRSRLFICPYLNYEVFLHRDINPQDAECIKKCKRKHAGKTIKT